MTVVLAEGALDTGRIPEGNTIKFWCNADANPNDVTYRWFLNDEVVIDATLNQLVSKIDSPSSKTYSLPAGVLRIHSLQQNMSACIHFAGVI